jgi:BirA family transcriptional regulator, biotin operon repressor / biotin---[acetyl-CoA-carboxylase] ligase
LSLSDHLRESIAVPDDVRAELARHADRLGPVAHRIHWLARTGSTNDVAAALAQTGAEEGTVVVAETQTAGRGRHGRTWFSPAGAGLYVSLLLRPDLTSAVHENRSALITLAAGVAVATAIRTATGLPAAIKWPNDVVLERRKLAGILVEAVNYGGTRGFVVLGVGINLRQAAFPPDVAGRATSIESEAGQPADRAQVLAQMLSSLAERYGDLLAGRFDAILSDWRRLASPLWSSIVEWDSASGVCRGQVEGIDASGALVVRVGDRVERLIAGEVRWGS